MGVLDRASDRSASLVVGHSWATLLEVYEQIRHLKQISLDFAAIAKLLADMGIQGKYECVEEWIQMSQALGDVERDFVQMIIPYVEIDHACLPCIYGCLRYVTHGCAIEPVI
jgi:hypothetical protein